MRRPGQSPRSNVPYAPVRTAGIAPVPETEAEFVASKASAAVVNEAVGIIEKSVNIQTNLNLNEIQGDALRDLEEGRLAVKKITADQIEANPTIVTDVYDDHAGKAYERFENLTGTQRQLLTTTVRDRESLHRTNHIGPYEIKLRRELSASKHMARYNTRLDAAGDAADPELTYQVATEMSEEMSSQIATQGIPPDVAIARLQKELHALYGVTVNGMVGQLRFQEALNMLDGPGGQLLSRDVRDKYIEQIKNRRSVMNWSRIDHILHDPLHPLHETWTGPNALAALREMNSPFEIPGKKEGPSYDLETGQPLEGAVSKHATLNDLHFMRLTQTVQSLRSGPGGTQGVKARRIAERTKSINITIAKDREKNPKSTLRRASLVSVGSPDYKEMNMWAFREDLHEQHLADEAAGRELTDRTAFMMQWSRDNGRMPHDLVLGLLTSMQPLEAPNAEEINQIIRSLEGLKEINGNAPLDFAAFEVGSAGAENMKFYKRWKAFRWGIPLTVTSNPGKVDFSKSSGYADGDVRMTAEQAYHKAMRQRLSEAGVDTAMEKVRRAADLQADFQEESAGWYKSAADALNHAGNSNYSQEEFGVNTLDNLLQLAKYNIVQGGYDAEGALMTAANQMVFTHGLGRNEFNRYDKDEAAPWSFDNPAFDDYNLKIPRGDGTSIPIGKEWARAELILDGINHLERGIAYTEGIGAAPAAPAAPAESFEETATRLGVPFKKGVVSKGIRSEMGPALEYAAGLVADVGGTEFITGGLRKKSSKKSFHEFGNAFDMRLNELSPTQLDDLKDNARAGADWYGANSKGEPLWRKGEFEYLIHGTGDNIHLHVERDTPETQAERKSDLSKLGQLRHDRLALQGDAIEVKQRIGVRENADGSHSTHLMRRALFDKKRWVAFPGLLQDADGTWIDMTGESEKVNYEEALKRGEVYDFGTDEAAAIAFADEGSWKDSYSVDPQPGSATLQALRATVEEFKNDNRFTTGHGQVVAEMRGTPGASSFPLKALDLDDLIDADVRPMPEDYVTLARFAEVWSSKVPNFSKEDAYQMISWYLLGERLEPGQFWEPGLVGGQETRYGVDGKGEGLWPSWRVEAFFPDGASRPVTFNGAKPRGWRKDFEQVMGPREEGVPSRLQNPIAQRFMQQINPISLAEQQRYMDQEKAYNQEVADILAPLEPTFDSMAGTPSGYIARGVYEWGVQSYVRGSLRNIFE